VAIFGYSKRIGVFDLSAQCQRRLSKQTSQRLSAAIRIVTQRLPKLPDLLPLGRWWLSFLHPLLLLYMSLQQLLRLWLMVLLDLLFPCLIGILPLDPLVFFILFSLKLLPLLLLLSIYFLFLLLVLRFPATAGP
jgi:hypothetical protein